MILSYSKENCELYRFPKKIIAGSKIHTIRADYANRWKVGMPIQHSTGIRTKYYNCFAQGVCMGIQQIEINFYNNTMQEIKIDNKVFIEITQLAINDGFNNPYLFAEYFSEMAQQSKVNVLNMKIIHFTNFKY